MEIILTRHAESKANKKGINQIKSKNWSDTSLSRYGEKKAKKLSLRLKDKKISKIYCSCLKRSIETAQSINNFHKAKLKEDERISEIKNDETNEELISRVDSFLEKLKSSSNNDVVLVVGHWSFNKEFLSIISENKPFQKLMVKLSVQQNACINLIKYEGKKFHLNSLNDTKHLNLRDKIRLLREGIMRSLPGFLKK